MVLSCNNPAKNRKNKGTQEDKKRIGHFIVVILNEKLNNFVS